MYYGQYQVWTGLGVYEVSLLSSPLDADSFGVMTLALVFAVGVFADDHHSVDLSPFFIWEGEKITQPVVGE